MSRKPGPKVKSRTPESRAKKQPRKILSHRANEGLDVMDFLITDDAYDVVRELRSLVFWDDSKRRWNPAKKLGPTFIEDVRNLLERYRLTP